MTPRSRRTSGGTSGSSTSTRRPDTDTSTTRRPDSGGPGGRVEISPDNLDTMATRLSNTGGRVDAVGTTLNGINVGPQSMGIVGGSFTGAAQTHVQTAREHVTRTRAAVQNAQNGTTATATTYREREAANAATMNAIDTTTTPPNPRGTTSTTPSGSTATPPPTTGSSGTGSTTPSSATTPSGTSTPPPTGTGSPPGGPPPSSPPGGTPPPGGGTPSAPIRNPFKRLVRANFNDADYATFDRAMHKMSEDPRSRTDIAGSGALTPTEQARLAEARKLVDVQSDTTMSKVIPASDWPKYTSGPVSGRYDSIGGFQARADDTSHLGNYADMRDGLRLDYTWKDSAGNTVVSFPPGGSAYVIEYPAGPPSRYQVPFGSAYDADLGQTAADAPIAAARTDMVNAGTAAGYAPGQLDPGIRTWPNTGTAVTGHGDLGVPEFTTPDRMSIPPGSPAYHVDATGKHLVGYYDPVLKDFVMPPPTSGGTP